jgi:hypothetical protein
MKINTRLMDREHRVEEVELATGRMRNLNS